MLLLIDIYIYRQLGYRHHLISNLPSSDFKDWPDASQWTQTKIIQRYEELEQQLQVSPPRCNMYETDVGTKSFIDAAKSFTTYSLTANKNLKPFATSNPNTSLLQGAFDGMKQSHLQQGAGMLPVTIGTDGLRKSSSNTFLTPEVLARSNLDVITDVNVREVSFMKRWHDNDPVVCNGVQYETTDGTVHSAVLDYEKTANKRGHSKTRKSWNRIQGEVIVSAGSIGSPHILLKSGIGNNTNSIPGTPANLQYTQPRSDTFNKDNKIPYVDLPVGQNLSDHCQIKAAFRTQVPTLNDRVNSTFGMIKMGLEFLFTRKGPLTMAPTPACAFGKSNYENS